MSLSYTYDDVKNELQKRGYILLSSEYENCKEKLLCLDKQGYKIFTSFDNISKHGKSSGSKRFHPSNPYTIENINHYAAINGLKRIYKPGNYVKAGVVVMQLIAQEQKQFNLFEEEDPRHDKLMQTIDFLNTKIGNRKIRIANQDLVRTWKMKQNFLSPSFTTNIKDIIQVKC